MVEVHEEDREYAGGAVFLGSRTELREALARVTIQKVRRYLVITPLARVTILRVWRYLVITPLARVTIQRVWRYLVITPLARATLQKVRECSMCMGVWHVREEATLHTHPHTHLHLHPHLSLNYR